MNEAYIESNEFLGLPVVPFEKILEVFTPEAHEILIAIGNKKMNDIWKKVFKECKALGYQIASYIHSSCLIHSDDIGEGNILLEKCLVYPFAKIGDGNLMWDHVLISHDCVVGDFNTFPVSQICVAMSQSEIMAISASIVSLTSIQRLQIILWSELQLMQRRKRNPMML